jgi:hypothetical protein
MGYYECEYISEIHELQRNVDNLEDKVGEPPFYLLGVREDGETEYVGVWFSERKIKLFIKSCRLKDNSRFKKNSPLGHYKYVTIQRFYVPDHLPIEPEYCG